MAQTVPREEQKELLNRLKDEQNRKISALADQYENTIERMVTEQTVVFSFFFFIKTNFIFNLNLGKA